MYKFIKVFANDDWTEIIKNIIKICDDLRNMLFKCGLEKNVSLTFDYEKGLHIYILSNLSNDINN